MLNSQREPEGARGSQRELKSEPEWSRESQREPERARESKAPVKRKIYLIPTGLSTAVSKRLLKFISFYLQVLSPLSRFKHWQGKGCGKTSGSTWLSLAYCLAHSGLLLLWNFAYTIQFLLGSQRCCHADTLYPGLIRAPFDLPLVARNLRNEMTPMILEFTICFKTWLLTFYIDLWKEKSLTNVKFCESHRATFQISVGVRGHITPFMKHCQRHERLEGRVLSPE